MNGDSDGDSDGDFHKRESSSRTSIYLFISLAWDDDYIDVHFLSPFSD